MFDIRNGSNGSTGLTVQVTGDKLRVPGTAANDKEALALIRAAKVVKVRHSFKDEIFKGNATSEFIGADLADQLTGNKGKGKGKGKDVDDTLADDILNERTNAPANV